MAENFATVLKAELEEIDCRRQARGLGRGLADAPAADAGAPQQVPLDPQEALRQAQKTARERRLVGLAFSGGGIRSATFNLGVLQGLAGLDLLKIFDYLSTVSGGGYIGGWLVAWMQRQGAAHVEQRLNPKSNSQGVGPAQAIRHLRRHSNYLAPRQDFLSPDRWVLWAIYLRNFLLNQLVLLPAALIVLLLARLVMAHYYPVVNDYGFLYDAKNDRIRTTELRSVSLSLLALGLVGYAAVSMFRAVYLVRRRADNNLDQEAAAIRARQKPVTDRRLVWSVVVPLVLAAAFICPLIPNALPEKINWQPMVGPAWLMNLMCFGGVMAGLVGCAFLFITPRQGKAFWQIQTLCLAAGFCWGALLYGACALIGWFFEWDYVEPLLPLQVAATAKMATFAPPLLLFSVVVGLSLMAGLLRDFIDEELREWFASLAGWLLFGAAIWMAVNLIALYATALVLWAGPWVQTALGTGWLVTMAGGVLAAGGERTGGNRPTWSIRELIARGAVPVFVVGIFIMLSLLVHVVVDNPPAFDLTDESVWPYRVEPKHPTNQIRVTRTGASGFVRVERKREYAQVPDEAESVRQQYWLGMLYNIPRVPHYRFYLDKDDADYVKTLLQNARLPLARAEKLQELRAWRADEFRLELKRRLVDAEDALHEQLIKAALDHSPRDDKGRFLFKIDYVKHLEFTRQLSKKDSDQVEDICHHRLNIEEWQDKLDEVFPEAWLGRLKGQILLRLRGPGIEGEFSYGRFLGKMIGCLFACGFVLGIAARQVDVNAFSLHGLYLNRLVRAYLGASRERTPDPVDGFDPDDDLKLAKLKPAAADPYFGPYPIINTALNLVHTKELAWQERMAESFVLTPLYCGSKATDYRATNGAEGAYAGDVTLGTAMTLSGAAASPNMGYHSSAAITFLLTIFNARLGAWLGNPKRNSHWQEAGPRWAFWHLFKELLGQTNESGKYVYLSDGGHFENLGVYELIRRRCHFIVVCDSGQDENCSFEDLGNLVRKVRIDFEIRIELAPDCLLRQKEPGPSRWHCAIGKIRYDDVDADAVPGVLVYIKPSLTGDEPADVLHYAASHPTFPHETTANQFYTESQFESYRALGQHIAEAVFQQALDDARDKMKLVPADVSTSRRHRYWCRELFTALSRRWFAMPPDYDAKFVEATHGYINLQEAFRQDSRLWQLTFDIYPELDPSGALARNTYESHKAVAERRAIELHVLAQMLQVMENAYLSLDLEANYAHARNRGWLDVFHRWTSAKTFRLHWPILRGEYARDFVQFCEKQMRLGEVEGEPMPLHGLPTLSRLDRLLLEFADQWPDRAVSVKTILDDALKGHGPRAWAVYPLNPYPLTANAATEKAGSPAGLILVSWAVSTPDTGSPMYDLFVWMRGAYRNTGLGRPALRTVLVELRETLRRPFRLRLRLPVADLTGPGGKLQKAMWLTFFHQLDFIRVEHPSAAGDQETVIELQREIT